MNGGRKKWLAEGPRGFDRGSQHRAASYTASGPDNGLRAFLDQVQAAVEGGHTGLVDVRSPPSLPARSSRLPACPKPASAEATFPARAASPGAKPVMRTAPSNPMTI